MGTPSDGKTFPPDVECKECGDILLEDEIEAGICDACLKVINDDIAITSGQGWRVGVEEDDDNG